MESTATVNITDFLVGAMLLLITSLGGVVIYIMRNERDERRRDRAEMVQAVRDLQEAIANVAMLARDAQSKVDAHIETKHNISFTPSKAD